jgi:hypothetical protein
MARAIPLPAREQIVALRQQGHTYAQIAQQLGRKERGVREVCCRFRLQGAASLPIHYDRCGHPGSRFPAPLREHALQLKRQHRRWGAPLIRLQLADAFPGERLPGVRTLQSWFQAAGLQPLRAQPPPVDRTRGETAHAVWQLDAKERMRLADGSGTCGMTVVDEGTGAALGAAVFPPV